MYPGVKAGTVWILSNGWYLTKSTAGLVYGGVIYLKDKWNSKDIPDEAKFPFASARSTQQVYGSVKGAILSLYDRSKYYGNGLYKLYKPGIAKLQGTKKVLSASCERFLVIPDRSKIKLAKKKNTIIVTYLGTMSIRALQTRDRGTGSSKDISIK